MTCVTCGIFIILTNVSLSQVSSSSDINTDSDTTQASDRNERGSIAESIANSDNGQVGDQGRGRGRGRGCGRGHGYGVATLAQSAPVQGDMANKIKKVRPMITLCKQMFDACFQPGQNISIDEAMAKFDFTGSSTCH